MKEAWEVSKRCRLSGASEWLLAHRPHRESSGWLGGPVLLGSTSGGLNGTRWG